LWTYLLIHSRYAASGGECNPKRFNIALVLTPSPACDRRDAEKGILGKLALWTRQRIRYHRALHELHGLDDRDLDDIDLARADFPELAWRHATGAKPHARAAHADAGF
jgi:uncharacterized protein YjiS (DUF1127 family)